MDFWGNISLANYFRVPILLWFTAVSKAEIFPWNCSQWQDKVVFSTSSFNIVISYLKKFSVTICSVVCFLLGSLVSRLKKLPAIFSYLFAKPSLTLQPKNYIYFLVNLKTQRSSYLPVKLDIENFAFSCLLGSWSGGFDFSLAPRLTPYHPNPRFPPQKAFYSQRLNAII